MQMTSIISNLKLDFLLQLEGIFHKIFNISLFEFLIPNFRIDLLKTCGQISPSATLILTTR